MSMGYPDKESEIAIAKGKSVRGQLDDVKGVIDTKGLVHIKEVVDEIHVDDTIYSYVATLCSATRENPYIEL